MYLGYEDDTEEQSKMKYASQFNRATGLVSLEDGCINEFVQRGSKGAGQSANAFIEMELR